MQLNPTNRNRMLLADAEDERNAALRPAGSPAVAAPALPPPSGLNLPTTVPSPWAKAGGAVPPRYAPPGGLRPPGTTTAGPSAAPPVGIPGTASAVPAGQNPNLAKWMEEYARRAMANPSRYDDALVKRGSEVIERQYEKMREQAGRRNDQHYASRGLIGSSVEDVGRRDTDEALSAAQREQLWNLQREQANTWAQDRDAAARLGFGAKAAHDVDNELLLRAYHLLNGGQ